ncbi:hypothetical protein Q1695_003282 [Nippostrongylus brasiliensis]|nr:hypothetical protein Q1695_003282 [Nippostrongylus brasiliensis]
MAAHELEEDIGAIEEVDVGRYELYDAKQRDSLSVPAVPRRHPTAGVRNRCPYGCGKMVALRTIDYHRTNGCRPSLAKDEKFGDITRKRYYCCGVCFMEFVTRASFHEHLSAEHDVHPQIHSMTFASMDEFKRFVRWLELKGGAHFRYKSGSKRRQRGKGIFMACNRSGFVKSNSATGSERDRVGPYRMGHTCTAFIHGTQHASGRVTIEMCGDHYGHDVRMRLPPIIKSIIAQRQMEGESSADIIEYLRQHFLPFASENIYAQRACLVDNEELRTIHSTVTKKWEIEGIPSTCEIWEEELLDMVGIVREGVPRVRPAEEKTTDELAEEQNWPRPVAFVAKVRLKNGEFVPHDTILEVERENRTLVYQDQSASVSLDNQMRFDTSETSYPPMKKQLLSDTVFHESSNGDGYSSEEFIDVDGDADVERHAPSTSREQSFPTRRNYVPRGAIVPKDDVVQKLLFEIDSLRSQIVDFSQSVSQDSLHYLLLRVRGLSTMVGQLSPSTRTNCSHLRRGVSLRNNTGASATELVSTFEILSDDEDIITAAGDAFEYNPNIWK